MKSFLLLTFILILVIVLSCEPAFRSEVINNTNSEILLEIKFDKAEIESVWQGEPYIDYIKSILIQGGTLIDFDTNSLVSNIKINPDESFILQEVRVFKPDFFGVKYLKIYSDDTIFLDNKDIMKKVFSETSARNYQLIIK